MTFAGKKHSEESKEKTRQALLGKKHTKERIENMRLSLLNPNNTWRGRHHTDETKRKMSQSAPHGELNHNWKGDDVGNGCLHKWIRRHLPEPERCQTCNNISQLDLSNVTGIYNRDFKNWAYWCRLCHNRFDIKKRKNR